MASFDALFYGMHTMSWPAMHGAVEKAWNAGFRVANPSDFETAVRSALAWAIVHRELLRKLVPGDFVPLPALPRANPLWWRQISYGA